VRNTGKGAVLLLALLLVLPLTGCERKPETLQTTVFAMDTVMNLTVCGEQEVLNRAVEDLYHMEKQFSATLEDSAIFRLNQGETVSPSLVLQEVLGRSLALCALTDGALDLTAYPAVKAWGFTTGDYRVPDERERAALAEKIDYTQIELRYAENGRCDLTLPEGVQMDLGAVAKGYAGDMLAADLKAAGVTSALLDLGQSTIQTVGGKPDGNPWRIGIQDPHGEGYLAVLELNGESMGTSGGYQRYFEQGGETYWHIIDPKTAAPARSGLASVTVVSPSALVSDALSTALFVKGLQESVYFWQTHQDLEFDAVFILEDGSIYMTAGLEDSFTLAEGYEDREVTIVR